MRNKAAEICEKYLSKGDKIYVEGRLKNRQWQGEDGVTRYTTEVHVQEFTFLSTKKESLSNAQSNTAATPQQAPTANAGHTPTKEVSQVNEPEQDDDLPF